MFGYFSSIISMYGEKEVDKIIQKLVYSKVCWYIIIYIYHFHTSDQSEMPVYISDIALAVEC